MRLEQKSLFSSDKNNLLIGILLQDIRKNRWVYETYQVIGNLMRKHFLQSNAF
jgi:hypothetical protein